MLGVKVSVEGWIVADDTPIYELIGLLVAILKLLGVESGGDRSTGNHSLPKFHVIQCWVLSGIILAEEVWLMLVVSECWDKKLIGYDVP